MRKEYEDVIDNLDMSYYEYDNSCDIEFYTDAGEDFVFTVSKDNFTDDVQKYYENFDPEEHVYMWLDAKAHGEAGIPDVFELCDDATMIQNTLCEVAYALLEAERKIESEVI